MTVVFLQALGRMVMMPRINVPYFSQETEYSCGPASVRMMLAYYGVDISEEEIVTKARTSFEGTCNDVLAETASYFRMCFVQTELAVSALFDRLNNDIPILVNYINPKGEFGHFAVVIGYTDTHFVLNDPKNGKGYEITHDEFEKRWRSKDGKHQRWGLIFE